jgi:hypothetical protein
MKTKKTNSQNALTNKLQLHFTLVSVLALLSIIALNIYFMISQYQYDADSTEALVSVSTSSLPIIISIVLGYLLAPKNGNKVNDFFWATVIALIGLFIFITLQQISFFIPFFNGVYASAGSYSWQYTEVIRSIFAFIPSLLYFAYFFYITKKQSR